MNTNRVSSDPLDLLATHTELTYLVSDSDGEPILVTVYEGEGPAETGYCPSCGGPLTLRGGSSWRHDEPVGICTWRLDWPLSVYTPE